MIQPIGYFKIWRELFTKPIWLESTPEQKTILVTLLAMANFGVKEWEWGCKKYKAQKGQFVTSLESIANCCGIGISIKNIRTSLKRFENYGFLANQSTNKNRLITIINWELYQQNDNETASETASKRQANGKQTATREEGKERKNVKNILKDIYADYVTFLPDEHKKLIEQFGEQGTKDRIEKLNLYKGSTGKKYASDYLTILSWERKNQEKNNSGGQHNGNTGNNRELTLEELIELYPGIPSYKIREHHVQMLKMQGQ